MQAVEILNRENFGIQTPKSIPSEDCLTLKRYLTYAIPSLCGDMPLPFVAHLKQLKGKTSGRRFANEVGIDHSTLSRLLRADRAPELATAARIIKGSRLSDAHAYQIVADSVTISLPIDACRYIFSDSAPALQGGLAEQLKGYRSARDLSQRVLAGRANVDHTLVSRLESDDRFPSLPVFANLAFVLGLNARQVRGFLRTAAASVR